MIVESGPLTCANLDVGVPSYELEKFQKSHHRTIDYRGHIVSIYPRYDKTKDRSQITSISVTHINNSKDKYFKDKTFEVYIKSMKAANFLCLKNF